MAEGLTSPSGAETRPILGHGITSHTAEEREVRKRSVHEHTVNGNVDTNYHKILRRSASLDLETAFKRIKISQTVKPELCSDCQKQKCQCPAFTPEMPCSSALSMPIKVDSDQEDIPDLVPETTLQQLYPPVLSPSDEEADREVAAICKAPIYYRVRSRNTKRRRYYTYDALDYIAEQHIMKRQRYSPSQLQGHYTEH